MLKGGISTFLLKLPGCADKAAVICSGLTVWAECMARPHGHSMSIPPCALRVHPGGCACSWLCSPAWACSGTLTPKPISSQIPGTTVGEGCGGLTLLGSSSWSWAPGHCSSLLERFPCREHGGVVLGQLTLRKCWKASPREVKSDLWAFIWRFLCCLCVEGSLLHLCINPLSIFWTDTGKRVFSWNNFAMQTVEIRENFSLLLN